MNIFEKAVELFFLNQEKSKAERQVSTIVQSLPSLSTQELRNVYKQQQLRSQQPNNQWRRYEALLLLVMLVQPSVICGERLSRGKRQRLSAVTDLCPQSISRDLRLAIFTYNNIWNFRRATQAVANILNEI